MGVLHGGGGKGYAKEEATARTAGLASEPASGAGGASGPLLIFLMWTVRLF